MPFMYDPVTGKYIPAPGTYAPSLGEQGPIPTNFATGGKTTFTNADLAVKSLQGYDPAAQARSEQETFQRLNAGPTEPSTESLLQAAQGTLADTAQQQMAFNRAANPNYMQTAEQHTPEHTGMRDYARNVARAAQIGGGVLSPFTGGATGAFIAAPASAYLAGDEFLSAKQEADEGDWLGAAGYGALGGLDAASIGAIKAIRGLMPKAPGGPKLPEPGMHWTARQPAETPYRFSGQMPGQSDDAIEQMIGRHGPPSPPTPNGFGGGGGPRPPAPDPYMGGAPPNLIRESNVTGNPRMPLGSPSTPSNPPNYAWGDDMASTINPAERRSWQGPMGNEDNWSTVVQPRSVGAAAAKTPDDMRYEAMLSRMGGRPGGRTKSFDETQKRNVMFGGAALRDYDNYPSGMPPQPSWPGMRDNPEPLSFQDLAIEILKGLF